MYRGARAAEIVQGSLDERRQRDIVHALTERQGRDPLVDGIDNRRPKTSVGFTPPDQAIIGRDADQNRIEGRARLASKHWRRRPMVERNSKRKGLNFGNSSHLFRSRIHPVDSMKPIGPHSPSIVALRVMCSNAKNGILHALRL
jgi:hypothetical protein